MTSEEKISGIFGLKNENWKKHANPASVWTRFIILPFFALAVWSRVWIGWYSLIPLGAIIIWTFINPLFFSEQKSIDSWASKSVIGEMMWAKRNKINVPKHHESIIKMLYIIQASGLIPLVIGLAYLNLSSAIIGIILIYLGKMWFLDRMVWVYEEMKSNNHYKKILK
jgi:hypothetical protein